jgi:hypothetical protein
VRRHRPPCRSLCFRFGRKQDRLAVFLDRLVFGFVDPTKAADELALVWNGAGVDLVHRWATSPRRIETNGRLT